MNLLGRILGVPLSSEDRDAVFARLTRTGSPQESLQFFREGAQHNTAKSGALLSAQGIFVVVDVFALDHGWPNGLMLAALLGTLLGSLIVMINLRGTLSSHTASDKPELADAVRLTFELVVRRSARFNIALYLTILSLLLLAAAALTFVG